MTTPATTAHPDPTTFQLLVPLVGHDDEGDSG